MKGEKNMNIFQLGNKTMINGIEIDVPKNASISVRNNKVYINGKLYEDEKIKGKEIIKIVINGDVGSVKSDVDIECRNVNGDVDCGRDCDINGDVGGSVIAGRDIDCDKIGGNAKAGRDICY